MEEDTKLRAGPRELIEAIERYSIPEFEEILLRLRHDHYKGWVVHGSEKGALKAQLGYRTRDGGATALHVACRLHRVSFAEQLVYCDAPVDARDARGDTPLHIAAAHGLETVVVAIACVGGDISLQNRAGLTARQIADGCGGTGARIAHWLEVVEKRRARSWHARLPSFPLKACLHSHDKWANMGTFSEEVDRLTTNYQKECVRSSSAHVLKNARNEPSPRKSHYDPALMRD